MRFLIVSENSVYSHHIASLLHEDGHVTDIQEQCLLPITGIGAYLKDYPVSAVILDFQNTSPDLACRIYAEWELLCGCETSIMPILQNCKQTFFLNYSLAYGVHDSCADARLLRARLYALVRRKFKIYSDVIYLDPVRMDLVHKLFFINDSQLTLTPFEFRVMEELLRNRDRIMSRDRLLLCLSPEAPEYGKIRSLDVIVGRLRKKIRPFFSSGNEGIEVIRGIGYRYTVYSVNNKVGSEKHLRRQRRKIIDPQIPSGVGWRWSV
ncbi:TPA: winged helix-turn-helix domain-containing protein [Klebsiella quasipneumoniae subsp. similipneumoniae]